MNRLPRHRALRVLPALVLVTGLARSSPAQGNQRDADMVGTTSGIPLLGMRMMAPGDPIQLQLLSPGGSLAGLPFILVADLGDGTAGTPLVLPGEPGVLGVTDAFVPLVNGFGVGPSGLLPGLAGGLPSPGLQVAFAAPDAPRGARLVLQAAVMDATAPNGLAVTPLLGGNYHLLPSVLTRLPPSGTNLGQFGYGLAVADLDQDGVDEILVGERQGNGPATANAGRVYLYHGLSTTPYRVLDDPSPQAFSDFGSSIAVGDFNGDGFPDIVVGARLADAGAMTDRGKAVVYYGPGFNSTMVLFPPAPESRGQFGHWATCGDFDGDGFCDLAVSSIGATVGGQGTAGRVDIFFGPSLAPVMAFVDPVPAFGDRFGYRIESADFNRDGFADLAVAAVFKSLLPGGADDSGAIWVFSGPFLATTAYIPNPAPSLNGLMGADLACADIDNDGWIDIVAGAELDNSGGLTDQGSVFLIHGPFFQSITHLYAPVPVASDGFGSGVAVGDVNKDGLADLMVGQFNFTSPVFHAGRASILYGPDFLQATTVSEPTTGSDYQFGRRVRAGDLDGDGRADMVVGVPFSSASGISRAGAVYVIH